VAFLSVKRRLRVSGLGLQIYNETDAGTAKQGPVRLRKQ